MDLFESGYQRALRSAGALRAGAWVLVSPVMSRRMFFLDFIAYPLAILACLAAAFSAGDALAPFGLIVLGLGAWTLAEYLIHRFVLHHLPGVAAVHMAHHHAPRDLIGTPTAFTLAAFYLLAFWPLMHLAGLRPAAAFMAGLLAGYLAYAAVHYAVHHLGSGGSRMMRRLKRQHALHHHGNSDRNFGVTTAFWDWVFGTLDRR
jgi:sterol desaturase/sphingolipid hydroxylase (fatty acid hydroxylase superfamily)